MATTEVVDSEQMLAEFVQQHPAAVIWFSGEGCNVCSVLLPKVEAMLAEEYPRVRLVRVDCGLSPELAAQHGVFSIPTLLLFFDGRETQRFSRNFSLGQLREALARPYQLLFE